MESSTGDRGMANGNGNGNGPAWLQASYRLGVPAVLALGLVYFLAQHVDDEMHALTESLDRHVDQMQSDRAAAQLSEARMQHLFRQICLNTAETDAQRAGCQ